MPATESAAPRRTRIEIEAQIVRTETELTRSLERLERRRAAGLDCTIAEGLMQSVQARLASLHEHRNRVLQAEAEE
jgi:hypothetical protein